MTDATSMPPFATTSTAADAAPLPAGHRATTCPRCGAAFACGVGADRATPCFCASVELDATRRAELRARYPDCLCAGCLRALAQRPGESA
jgi:hypothetical protein